MGNSSGKPIVFTNEGIHDFLGSITSTKSSPDMALGPSDADPADLCVVHQSASTISVFYVSSVKEPLEKSGLLSARIRALPLLSNTSAKMKACHFCPWSSDSSQQLTLSLVVRSESVRNMIRERRMLEHLNHPFLCNLRYSFQDVEYLYASSSSPPNDNLTWLVLTTSDILSSTS